MYDKDNSLYRNCTKNKEITDTENDAKTSNLAFSRSDRNHLHYEKRNSNKIISNTRNFAVNHNNSYRNNYSELPRAYSTKKMETNYNYGNSRNQFKNTNKTYSTHQRKFETNTKQSLEYRTTQAQEPNKFKNSNYSIEAKRNNSKFQESHIERSYIKDHFNDRNFQENETSINDRLYINERKYSDKETMNERRQIKENSHDIKYGDNEVLKERSYMKDSNSKFRGNEEIKERSNRRENSHDVWSYSRNSKDQLFRERNDDRSHLDTFSSHTKLSIDEIEKDSPKILRKDYLSKTALDQSNHYKDAQKTGFKIFQTSKHEGNYNNLDDSEREAFKQSTKTYDIYEDKNDYSNKDKVKKMNLVLNALINRKNR